MDLVFMEPLFFIVQPYSILAGQKVDDGNQTVTVKTPKTNFLRLFNHPILQEQTEFPTVGERSVAPGSLSAPISVHKWLKTDPLHHLQTLENTNEEGSPSLFSQSSLIAGSAIC